MKLFRLVVHQKTFSEDELIINPKDFPEAKTGDIIEIHHPPPENDENYVEEHPRLLLQYKKLKEDQQQGRVVPDSLSIQQNIATSFGLKTYHTVSVKVVDPADVALDTIEFTFRDQYMGRSEMWRLKNYLTNTCMYMNKKIEFCGGSIRCQVYAMWSKGERVACGVLNEDTKLVFRSSTSMVYLFLQMSSEMWDLDVYGDLYYEKAIDGFLTDLFSKWKKLGSNHEVTIVLFSRTFYDAASLEEFPYYMRECLQKDYKGRFYEDFYRVAIQNERYDDWSCILMQLRKVFQEYLGFVLEYHNKPGVTIPKATNSSASQGNFLEVLNMSLNVFEKHYLDRSFERTGQLSVVITPGVGVFEVDRELTNITKQRIIDNGVGSDLVCVGEQPLHAVPLFKFHNKEARMNVSNDYSIPHWINLSFYTSNKRIPNMKFVPRIKMPPFTNESTEMPIPKSTFLPTSFYDYDAYDAQVFQWPITKSFREMNISQNKVHRSVRSSGSLLSEEEVAKSRRKLSDPDILHRTLSNTRSEPIAIPRAAASPVVSPMIDTDRDREFSPRPRMVVGSEGSPPRDSKPLINPFDPTHVTIKLTSNRRRWTHIFPKGPNGVPLQLHHQYITPSEEEMSSRERSQMIAEVLNEYLRQKPNAQPSTSGGSAGPSRTPGRPSAPIWGNTEWTPGQPTVNDVLIGVDWKSLTIPACLPITTDYLPDERTMDLDYLVSLYSLVPDSGASDIGHQRWANRRVLTTEEVFKEVISQRLSQGFQLIVADDNEKANAAAAAAKQSVVKTNFQDMERTYFLSIGRLFHGISLSGNQISVTRYKPRHPYPGFKYQYRYRFYAPHHGTYEESYALFKTEKLENFNWNYLDNYICTAGSSEFPLMEALKYWRFRVYILPFSNAATKKILEGGKHFDVYRLPTAADYQMMVDNFLKFFETVVNKIKRLQVTKKPRMSLNIVNNAPLLQPRRNSMSNFLQSTSRSGDRLFPAPLRSVTKGDRNKPGQMSQEDHPSADPAFEENVTQPDTVLKSSASNQEIIEAMKHPINGVPFIGTAPSLPNFCFVAAEAINWLITHMEGPLTNEKAFQIMISLSEERLICHASGNFSRPFKQGFHLFYICTQEDRETFRPTGDLSSFENEWLEVEVQPALHWGVQLYPTNLNPAIYSDGEYGVPHFLCEDINVDYADLQVDGPLFKRSRLETDVANRSDRVEWGHVKYQTVFKPDQAYELVIEWLTSSGPIIGDLLNSWNRKAQSCGLQMVPLPHDPLALPYSTKSDPLRGPIYVPLETNCLLQGGELFSDFAGDTASERLFLFQEAIVQRFGFLNCHTESSDGSSSSPSREHQYVHCTGGVFVLFSCPITRSRSRVTSMSKGRPVGRRYSLHTDSMRSPHEAYITRHVSGKNKDDYDNSRKLGFLWSWNHMISKRWRSNAAFDNNYMTRMLKDFREFCANADNRLHNFWEECWELKVACSAKNTAQT